ncbi:hypothetical protein [Lacrimispora amygdalina]|nr:hypothetical protein [Clostridium indicum]
MRKEYARNKIIALYGNAKEIAEAEAVLDTLDGLEGEFVGHWLPNEGELRLKLQDAIDLHKMKASILVDGNTVYPYVEIIKQYERLKKSGKLEKMSNTFYQFLHLNFDIAHYDKYGYIAYYNNNFATLQRKILDRATTPAWHTDVRRILDHIQEKTIRKAA